MAAVFERGALEISELGVFVPISYENIRPGGHEFASIPENSVDLVTVLQVSSLSAAPLSKIACLSHPVLRVSITCLRTSASFSLAFVNVPVLRTGRIMAFLAGVRRILRAGGCLIIREHDLDEEGRLLPLLDCAHMVFNAATAVPLSEERKEIRGFRPISQWRAIRTSFSNWT